MRNEYSIKHSDILFEYQFIYEVLRNLHIVPKYNWTTNKLKELCKLFSFLKLPHFVDDIGNIIVNVESDREIKTRIEKGDVSLILQAHLDHPGGVITKEISAIKGFYAAQWFGGYSGSLEGREMLIADLESNEIDNVLIEMDVSHAAGRFLYFKGRAGLGAGSRVLHFNDMTSAGFKPDRIKGWALDDLLGCASILYCMYKHPDPNNIGVLTLGEEVGSYGLSHFCRSYLDRSLPHIPPVINIDTPEQEEGRFVCGEGIRIRTADKRAKYSDGVVTFLKETLNDVAAIPLTRGATEASLITEMGYTAGGLAVPIQNIHNGSRNNLWIEETAVLSDVFSLCSAVLNVITSSNKHRIQRTATGRVKGNKIEYVNHARELCSKLDTSHEYCDFMIKVSDHWNEMSQNYGFNINTHSENDYQELRKSIGSQELDLLDVDMEKYASELVPRVYDLVAGGPMPQLGDMKIVSTLRANFNACNTNGNIALSLDKISKGDVRRVLAHEVTHWVCHRLYDSLPFSNYVQLFLQEGVACYVSKTLCETTDAEALGIPENTANYYESISKELREMFSKIILGDIVELKEHPKHTVLRARDNDDPFRISKSNRYNKYGYYLGLQFVKYCVRSGVQIGLLFSDPYQTEKLLGSFLTNV